MEMQIFNTPIFLGYLPEQEDRSSYKKGAGGNLTCWYFFSGNGYKKAFDMHPRKSKKEEHLETEGPLPEKDEVKKAEQRTMEQQKKVEKQPGKNKT